MTAAPAICSSAPPPRPRGGGHPPFDHASGAERERPAAGLFEYFGERALVRAELRDLLEHYAAHAADELLGRWWRPW